VFINPTIAAIIDTCCRFQDIRLFEMDAVLLKGSSFELRSFKTLMSQRLEKAHEKIMTRQVFGYFHNVQLVSKHLEYFLSGKQKKRMVLYSGRKNGILFPHGIAYFG
jgi:hypothetical protein